MVRGNIKSTDVRAMAVVGTRHPSPKGLDNASRISRGLAARGVTVVSGLASGIDSAAHRGAIEGGGRTIAVFGTGIDSVYPAQNAELAAQVANYGACVSQFWPAMRGARWTFPARNLVTSGLSIGTVVVEAGETSGARLQAIAALDHGKRVLLLRRWAESQPWAIEVATRPGVIIVESVDEVIDAVDRELLVDTSAAL
jgi:DNA processing protein